MKRRTTLIVIGAAVFLLLLITLPLVLQNLELKDRLDARKSLYVFKAKELARRAEAESNGGVVLNLIDPASTDLRAEPKLALERELVIGKSRLSGRDFYLFTQVAADDSGNIFVFEFSSSTIHKFSNQGFHLRTIGRKGQGPGEFLRGVLFYIDERNRLFTFDDGNQRLSEFSTNGELLNMVRLAFPYRARSLTVDKDGSILLAGFDHRSKAVLHEYSSEGALVRSFGDAVRFNKTDLQPQEYMVLNAIAGGIHSRYANFIFYTQANPYEVRKYDRSGKVLLRIFRENRFMLPAYYEVLKEGDELFYESREPAQSVFIGVWQDRIINWIFINPLLAAQIGAGSIVDVFDLDGNLLQSIEIDQSLTATFLSRQGKIYCYGLDGQGHDQVVRYGLIF